MALDEAERVQALDLLALERGLEGEVEIGERLDRRQAGGAHRGDEPAIVAQRDLRAEESLDGDGALELAAVERTQDVVEGFERTGEFEIRELRAHAVAEGERRMFHRPTSARRAYAAKGRRSTWTGESATDRATGVLRATRSGARTSE